MQAPYRFLALAVVALFAGACADATPVREASAPAAAPAAAPAPAADAPAGRARIVFLGDSLTAGLGLAIDQSYPSLIQARLDAGGFEYEVVNAGVSGDTSAGGVRRLEWALDDRSEILVLALGANDGLRGLSPAELRNNLARIIEAARARGLRVVLTGMEAPPNYGADYTAAFRNVYPDLVREYDVEYVPFLLQGVAGDPSMNQADGIHPNASGARVIADTVWDALEPLLAPPAAGAR